MANLYSCLNEFKCSLNAKPPVEFLENYAGSSFEVINQENFINFIL
jgi:hypothetical protein